jgi:hypothetical protein
MENLLKPRRIRQILIGFLPGFLFILFIIAIYNGFNWADIKKEVQGFGTTLSFVLIIIAFIVGQVFDSLRDGIFEILLNHNVSLPLPKKKRWLLLNKIKWEFFATAKEDRIDNLDDNFYIWYLVNFNLFLCILTVFIIIFINKTFYDKLSTIGIVLFIISLIAFLIDSLVLRIEVGKITNDEYNVKDGEKKQ